MNLATISFLLVAADPDPMSMAEVVENVERNERKYANFDLRFTEAYKAGRVTDDNPLESCVRSGQSVVQGRMMYMHRQDSMITVNDGKRKKTASGKYLFGCDGEKTISISNKGRLANVHDRRKEVMELVRPHMLLMLMNNAHPQRISAAPRDGAARPPHGRAKERSDLPLAGPRIRHFSGGAVRENRNAVDSGAGNRATAGDRVVLQVTFLAGHR